MSDTLVMIDVLASQDTNHKGLLSELRRITHLIVANRANIVVVLLLFRNLNVLTLV